MRIRFTSISRSMTEWEPGPLLFGPIETPRRRIGPLLSSLVLHGGFVALITTLSQLSWVEQPVQPTEPSRYRLEILSFRAPEPMFYAPPEEPKPVKKPAPRTAPPKPAAAVTLIPPPEPKPPVQKVRREFTPPAHIELPPVEHALPTAPVILQPETKRAALPKSVSAPAVAAWSRKYAPRRDFIAPGRSEPAAPAPKLDAPPKLTTARAGSTPGALNVALAQARNSRPALPLPESAPPPVRAPGGNGEGSGDLARSPGDPAQLIIMSPVAATPGSTVEAPRGVRNAPPAGEPGGAATNGSRPESSKPSSQAGTDSREGRSEGAGTRADRTVGTQPSPAASGSEQRIRVAHAANGSFDVVITSATPPALEGLGVSLTGSPVFTVYLRVGDDREWLLQYCLPVAAKASSNPYEVFVGNTPQITPPYPLNTVIPKSILGRQSADIAVFHGRLNTAGQFRSLEMRVQSNALAQQILPLLDDWRFRPAAVDGRPAEIEVLLVVPGKVN